MFPEKTLCIPKTNLPKKSVLYPLKSHPFAGEGGLRREEREEERGCSRVSLREGSKGAQEELPLRDGFVGLKG